MIAPRDLSPGGNVVRAVTQDVRRDGEHLFPAMPYTDYTKVTRDDVLAIRAYLATLPAVSNGVTADRLSFPLSVRANMAAWNKLYFTPGEFRRDPDKSEAWNRGAYLPLPGAGCDRSAQ